MVKTNVSNSSRTFLGGRGVPAGVSGVTGAVLAVPGRSGDWNDFAVLVGVLGCGFWLLAFLSSSNAGTSSSSNSHTLGT